MRVTLELLCPFVSIERASSSASTCMSSKSIACSTKAVTGAAAASPVPWHEMKRQIGGSECSSANTGEPPDARQESKKSKRNIKKKAAEALWLSLSLFLSSKDGKAAVCPPRSRPFSPRAAASPTSAAQARAARAARPRPQPSQAPAHRQTSTTRHLRSGGVAKEGGGHPVGGGGVRANRRKTRRRRPHKRAKEKCGGAAPPHRHQ